MLIKEITDMTAPLQKIPLGMIQKVENIKAQLKLFQLTDRATIRNDLRIDIKGDVKIRHHFQVKLQFGKIMGDFDVCYADNFNNLEDYPEYVEGDVLCKDSNLQSLHNIHKHVKYIGGEFYFAQKQGLPENVLGIFFIEGLKRGISGAYAGKDIPFDGIMNKYLEEGRDLHGCQEALIEAGYEKQARI